MDSVQVPQAALDLEKEFELFRSVAYQDPRGVWTAGFGHTHGVTKGTTIDMDMALRLLQLDTEEAVRAVWACVKPPVTLNEGQLAALTDFVFNLGEGALKGSTLLRRLNSGDFQSAAEEFRRWDHIHIETGEVVENARLRERRCRERDLFLGLEAGTSLKQLQAQS